MDLDLFKLINDLRYTAGIAKRFDCTTRQHQYKSIIKNMAQAVIDTINKEEGGKYPKLNP